MILSFTCDKPSSLPVQVTWKQPEIPPLPHIACSPAAFSNPDPQTLLLFGQKNPCKMSTIESSGFL